MDQSKEVFPKPRTTSPRRAAVTCCDGRQGQGNAKRQKIRAVKGHTSVTVAAGDLVRLAKRPEVDAQRIAIYGISMGRVWSLRLASYDGALPLW